MLLFSTPVFLCWPLLISCLWVILRHSFIRIWFVHRSDDIKKGESRKSGSYHWSTPITGWQPTAFPQWRFHALALPGNTLTTGQYTTRHPQKVGFPVAEIACNGVQWFGTFCREPQEPASLCLLFVYSLFIYSVYSLFALCLPLYWLPYLCTVYHSRLSFSGFASVIGWMSTRSSISISGFTSRWKQRGYREPWQHW